MTGTQQKTRTKDLGQGSKIAVRLVHSRFHAVSVDQSKQFLFTSANAKQQAVGPLGINYIILHHLSLCIIRKQPEENTRADWLKIVFLLSLNLQVFYHECCSLIGYSIHCLCCGQQPSKVCWGKIRRVLEMNDFQIYIKTIRIFALDFCTRQKSRAHNVIAH